MLTYKTKTLQVRVTDDEYTKLERIVSWMNEDGELSSRQKRRESIDFEAWGPVTISDVVRWLIKSNQVDVLHARIPGRTTKRSLRRTTR